MRLSPQCGFSITVHGPDIAAEQPAAKLRLVIEVAREVWQLCESPPCLRRILRRLTRIGDRG
jgi:hypothetical protein